MPTLTAPAPAPPRGPPRPTTPPERADDARLSRRELGVVAACWLAWAGLSVANRVLDSVAGDPHAAARVGGALAVAVGEALCWIAITPGLLRLTARLGTERTRPAVRPLVLGAVGVLVALAMGAVGGELRHLFPLPAGAALPPGGGPPIGPLGAPNAAPPGPAPGTPGGPAPGPPRAGLPPWVALLNALVLYLAVVAVGLARAYARRAQARREQAARLEAQLAEARLDALRRQLDPHFLFNTLNAVSTLVERDPKGVRRMIARLGELLRHSFEGDARPEVPLGEELALLGRYVDIMQVRFQGRLTVATRAEPALLDALVPALVLQPLVENAIKHGVERAAGPGAVTVEAAPERDAAGAEVLVLRVTDNGPGPGAAAGDAAAAGGLPEGDRPDGGSPRRGVGLRNTVARLEELYGPGPRLTLRPAPGGGTTAEVRLPLHYAVGAQRPGRAGAPDLERHVAAGGPARPETPMPEAAHDA